MGLVTNLTDFAVGSLAGKDHLGVTQVVCVVKATYAWDERGLVTPAKDPEPVHEADVYAGKPDVSGLLQASDLCPPSLVSTCCWPVRSCLPPRRCRWT